MTRMNFTSVVAALCVTLIAPAAAQEPVGFAQQRANGSAPVATGLPLPPGYVIGPADVLAIVFWRDKDLSLEVRVRPDGRITLPLLNDVQAAGLTPDELRLRLMEGAAKYVQEPSATVIVREINSRSVFITGNVAKPGAYPLHTELNVLQLIAQAGGLVEFADAEGIRIVRNGGGAQTVLKFNYKDVSKGKQLQQNIQLKPGDTVIVP